MADDFDYTRQTTGTDVPFSVPGEDTDDFVIGGDALAPAMSADDIEKDNSFRQVPVGDHTLVITGFRGAPEELLFNVNLNGRQTSFNSYKIKVKFGLPGDPKCSVEDSFLLPPEDNREMAAYFHGVPDGKKDGGWQAKKFVHFINRIGFNWPPNSPLPEAAKRLGNWKGRAVAATIQDGGEYYDSNGALKKGWNKIKPFSFGAANHASTGNSGNAGAIHTSRPSAPPAPTAHGQQAPSRQQAAPPARELVTADDL